MKQRIYLIVPGLLLLCLLTFIGSCKKDNNSPSNPTNGRTLVVFNPSLTYGILTDIDGNEYKTIKIGTQTWMAENLRTFKYNDGTVIPNIMSNTEWNVLTSEAYCTYNNTTKNDSIATFGCLYNWHAVNSGKLAPNGWHVPTNAEWKLLGDYLIANGYNFDNTTSDNKIAKSMASATNWSLSTVTGAPGNTDHQAYINKSGFSALAGGYRYQNGSFYSSEGEVSRWWTSTITYDSGAAYSWAITSYKTNFESFTSGIRCGCYIRCIKD